MIMPSGWDVYYVLFLAAALAVGLTLVVGIGISLVFSRKASPKFDIKPLNSQKFGARINTRFFMAVNTAMVLLGLGMILIPCVSTRESNGVWATLSFGSLFGIGIILR